jgi:hypothetical protein
MAQKNAANNYHGALVRVFRYQQHYRDRRPNNGLLSTRRHIFASSNQRQRTQPIWACRVERERVRLANGSEECC